MISLNKIIKRREKKNGLPPGTPVYTGEKKEGNAPTCYSSKHIRAKEALMQKIKTNNNTNE